MDAKDRSSGGDPVSQDPPPSPFLKILDMPMDK